MTIDGLREALSRPLDTTIDFLDDAWLSGERNARVSFDLSVFRIEGMILHGLITLSVMPRPVMNIVEDHELYTALLARIKRETGDGHVVVKSSGVYVATWRPRR